MEQNLSDKTMHMGDCWGLVFMRFFRFLSASALLRAAVALTVRRAAGAALLVLVKATWIRWRTWTAVRRWTRFRWWVAVRGGRVGRIGSRTVNIEAVRIVAVLQKVRRDRFHATGTGNLVGQRFSYFGRPAVATALHRLSLRRIADARTTATVV